MDVLVESWDVELSEGILVLWKLLEGKEVLEDDSAGLKEHMSKTLLTVSWLKDSKAA